MREGEEGMCGGDVCRGCVKGGEEEMCEEEEWKMSRRMSRKMSRRMSRENLWCRMFVCVHLCFLIFCLPGWLSVYVCRPPSFLQPLQTGAHPHLPTA